MAKLLPINPAVYSDELIGPLADALTDHGFPPGGYLLDPFAGTGFKLAEIGMLAGAQGVIGVEIEPGYRQAGQSHPCVLIADSRDLSWTGGGFDGAVTSCAYPSGVSDNFHSSPEDESKRHTYIHRLRGWLGSGYELQPGNAGGMNPRRSPKALEAFYDIHRAVWREVFRVLKPGAPFVVNTKDTLSIPFRMHTEEQLIEAGFVMVDSTNVMTPGLNHGKNAELKVKGEDITIVRKPWTT